MRKLSRKRFRGRTTSVLLMFLSLVITVLACGYEEKVGQISVDGTPAPFALRGETTYVWEARVTPNTQYDVIVEPESEDSVASMQIWVTGKGNRLAFASSPSGKSATATFVGPEDRNVGIYVSVVPGELGEDLGIAYTIQLRQAEP